jgi:hypothetical protein
MFRPWTGPRITLRGNSVYMTTPFGLKPGPAFRMMPGRGYAAARCPSTPPAPISCAGFVPRFGRFCFLQMAFRA